MRPARSTTTEADVRLAPCSHVSDGGDAGDLRCRCGSLLARLVPAGVELKCRRCKQTWTVPVRST
jgi:hypothetical protein